LIELLLKLLDIQPDPQNYGAIEIRKGVPPKLIELTEETLNKQLGQVFAKRESCILQVDLNKVMVKPGKMDPVD